MRTIFQKATQGAPNENVIINQQNGSGLCLLAWGFLFSPFALYGGSLPVLIFPVRWRSGQRHKRGDVIDKDWLPVCKDFKKCEKRLAAINGSPRKSCLTCQLGNTGSSLVIKQIPATSQTE
jgi:hypothetical protein